MLNIPPAAKIAIGLGSAVVAAFTAYSASIEGVEHTQDKANEMYDRFKNRKNAQPDQVE